MITTAKPMIFFPFANNRDDRARDLRNLAEEARQVQRTLATAERRGHCELALSSALLSALILAVTAMVVYRP